MGTPPTRTVLGSAPQPADLSLGLEAVQLGMISNSQYLAVLAELQKAAPKGAKTLPSLGDALVEKGLISRQQLDALRIKPEDTPVSLGKYQILREVGRGGMGVVYEAKDTELGRRVALKMLLGPRASDSRESKLEEETRFIREAKVTANLPKHPNIVGIYETGILQGHRYIAMEFVDGRQLMEWRKHATMALRHHVALLRDVALAIDHANRHGIIHRDLKPANILVDAQNRPHVTDFGLAKSGNPDTAHSLTAAGMVMGTPAYMSPEQAQGRKGVDRRTDVWSLGVILYEFLAGRQPFRGDTPLDTVLKAVNDPVVPPSQARSGPGPQFDRGIENICLKALAKNPRDRYLTAKAMADDLTHWIKGEEITVEPPKPDRSKLTRYATMAAIALVAVVGGSLMLTPSGPTPAELAATRAQTLVDQGQRLMQQGKHADALVAFGRALAENPSNRAAATGKKDAEQKLVAVAAAAAKRDAPKEVPAPAPQPPKPTAAEEAAKKAREAQEAESRRIAMVSKELADLDQAVNALREAESFGPGRELLDQALKRHTDQEWAESIEDRQKALRNAVDAVYPPLKDQAVEAKRRGDAPGVDRIRARVTRWKWPGAVETLEEAISKAEPPRPAVEAPAAPSGIELGSLRGHRGGVSSAAISPDGRLALTSSFDDTVRLWDVTARKERSTLLEGASARSVGFSRDGKWMAAGLADGTIRVWDPSKLEARTIPAHDNQVLGISFSPDSKLVASASTDGSARIWDLASGAMKSKFEGHPKGAMSISFSPDGKLLAVGSVEPQVRLWKVGGDRDARTLEGHHEGAILALAFSPDGRVLASGGADSKIVLWELDSGRRRTLDGHTASLKGLVYGPDGRWIASASLDGSLRVWDLGSGAVKAAFSDDAKFFGLACSRKGDLLAGCSGAGHLRLWDPQQLDAPKGK